MMGCTANVRPGSTIGRLAYVGLDDNIYTVPLDGGEPRRVSTVTGGGAAPGRPAACTLADLVARWIAAGLHAVRGFAR